MPRLTHFEASKTGRKPKPKPVKIKTGMKIKKIKRK